MFMIMQMFCSTQCELNSDIPKLSIVMANIINVEY